MEMIIIPIVIGALCYNHEMIHTRFGGLGNKRTSGDHLNYYIIENGQNTEKSPGDLKRLPVTKTQIKNS